jgi:hypothetical protein
MLGKLGISCPRNVDFDGPESWEAALAGCDGAGNPAGEHITTRYDKQHFSLTIDGGSHR